MPDFLTAETKRWIRRKYPQLSIREGGVSGAVSFTATHNDESGLFQIIEKGAANDIGGRLLSGKFNISIQERTKKVWSNLPAVYVEKVDPLPERHFNQMDKSACLCSPFDEDKFLVPQLQFEKFFEELVIPFLYGQAYYSLEKRWPWPDLMHGATGLLEAYYRKNDPIKAGECVQKLSLDATWSGVKSALAQKSEVKGHLLCFCPKADKIRRCHPDAWKGLQKLRCDIKAQKISIP